MGLSRIMRNDQEFRNLVSLIRNKRILNLSHPVTFTDKLNWLINHTDYRQYSPLADKYQVREFVKRKGGERYLNQIYGIYSNEEDINFDDLPESFVLKPTHGSKMIFFCHDKKKIDVEMVRKECGRWLRKNYYSSEHEVNYSDIPPRILCEKLLLDDTGKVPSDYKFYCFHGIVRIISVDFDRFGNHTRSFYNPDWTLQPYKWNFRINSTPSNRPTKLDEMLSFSETLSTGFPFVRVDLYHVDNEIFFGELTFTPGAATPRINLAFDTIMGQWLDIQNSGDWHNSDFFSDT